MLSSNHSVLKGISWKWRKGNRVFRTIGPHKGFNYCRRSGSGRGGCVLRRREDWEKTSLGKWWIFDLYLICTQIVPFSIYWYYQHRVLLGRQRDGTTIFVSFVFSDVACVWYPGCLCRGHSLGRALLQLEEGLQAPSEEGSCSRWVRGCRRHEHVPKETHCMWESNPPRAAGDNHLCMASWPSEHLLSHLCKLQGLRRALQKRAQPGQLGFFTLWCSRKSNSIKNQISLCLPVHKGQRIHKAPLPTTQLQGTCSFLKACDRMCVTAGRPFCQNTCC